MLKRLLRPLAFLSFLNIGPCFAQQLPLMPLPAGITQGTGSVPVTADFSVMLSGVGSSDPRVKAAAERLFTRLAVQTGIPTLPARILPPSNAATLAIVVETKDHKPPQRLGDDESYSLEVANGRIRISAGKPLGALRGIETFLQLVQQNTNRPGAPSTPGFSVPVVTIHDQPRFGWRGLSLDVSRHFIPIERVERTLDGMSAVKLDVLHWHLSDDQGFRVESRRYPRLQEFGSNGLYYTQAQIRQVIAYARERGIRIVPEFDMPGHATSWLVGYPRLGVTAGPFHVGDSYGVLSDLMDPTKESTYRFLNGFVGEMASLFPDQYFHIGGDEVEPKEWKDSEHVRAFMAKHHLTDFKALQAYFNARLEKIVARHHKHMIGWDEVLHPDLPKSIVIESWRGQMSLWDAARQGYQGILSAGYYLDLMYPASYHFSIDPLKIPPPAPNHEGMPVAPKEGAPKPGTSADLTPEQEKRILGGEAAMWIELASDQNLDSRLWPRLAVIAERLWSPESDTDTASMYARLRVTNHWLEWLGLTQRSALERMRQRQAGPFPYQPLDTVASILEPTKGYSRHAERVATLMPLTRLEDAIPPESNAAREFRNAVDAYLAAPKEQRNSAALRQQLQIWADAAADARPMFAQQTLLTPDSPVLDAITALCKAGQEALTYLDSGNVPLALWKQLTWGAINPYVDKRVGDLLVRISPGVEKLVEAVPGS